MLFWLCRMQSVVLSSEGQSWKKFYWIRKKLVLLQIHASRYIYDRVVDAVLYHLILMYLYLGLQCFFTRSGASIVGVDAHLYWCSMVLLSNECSLNIFSLFGKWSRLVKQEDDSRPNMLFLGWNYNWQCNVNHGITQAGRDCRSRFASSLALDLDLFGVFNVLRKAGLAERSDQDVHGFIRWSNLGEKQ